MPADPVETALEVELPRAHAPSVARATRALAGCALGLGAVGLAGAVLDAPALARIVPGLPAMLPCTALCVLAGAAALLLRAHGAWPRLAIVAAVVPLTLGVSALLTVLLGPQSSVHALFAPSGAASELVRVSPHSALALALAGTALLVCVRRPVVAQTLASGVALLAVTALAGHVYGVDRLSGITDGRGMALHTALALLALAAGTMLLAPERGIGALLTSERLAGMMARRLLVPALLMPVLLGPVVLAGQRAGLYGSESIAGYLVVAIAAVAATLVGLSARTLEGAERERERAEAARLASLVRERDARTLVAAKEEALHARDEFLSIASHELRTPLAALRLQLQMALRRAGSAGEDGPVPRLEAADRMAGRMAQLVEGLIEVARINSGRLSVELEPEELELGAVVRQVAARSASQAERARCSLVVSAEECPGRWDRARLEQVLVQLLSNALKYGAGRPVELRVAAEGSAARVTVRDHGIGMAPEVREQVFQRFERAVSTRHYGGFGLGLWIAREIVEAHGGRIAVESAPGQGACFTVLLPRRPGAPLPE